LKYIPTTCTSIEDIVLEWEDFQHFYDIISPSIVLEDHDFLNYPKLTHFLQSQSAYKKFKFIHFVGPKRPPLINLLQVKARKQGAAMMINIIIGNGVAWWTRS
jgi:hypothetical protein